MMTSVQRLMGGIEWVHSGAASIQCLQSSCTSMSPVHKYLATCRYMQKAIEARSCGQKAVHNDI